ncbi:GMC family oxidoreductase N-terminal domain-containing protein [Nocardia sp. NPDC049190]|uniref:GMC family oxidoreductase n=1 Tax=Nocardia sp. NPDC049190 TaxID=3155650 RepID=UPI0033CFC49E
MTQTSSFSTTENFDYVIVGAGSAGCVLANRLTEDPSARVLLLEAGPTDSLDAIQVPALFSSLFGSEVDWDYELEKQAHYHGSRTFPRGKTLGGSSSINLMIYIRGHRIDFDGWGERGNVGWDYDSVLPYFIKAEHNSRLSSPFHGSEGPLHIEDRLFTHELSHAWVDAATEWGLTRNDDFNGADQIGAGVYQVYCHNGRRWSGADGYLRPALLRPNLVVRVGAHVTRVLLEGDRARGVAYIEHGTEHTAHAESEVLLSGGVINSPQLLLLSGVGPADQLRAQGIDVVADVPGVGENLHDHTMVPLVWATQHSNDLLDMAVPENMAVWQSGRGGPFASNGGEVGAFMSTSGFDVPNVQLIGGATAFVDHGHTSPPLPNFTMLTGSTHPRSRGRLWLRSTDPLTHPHIDPAYFTHPDDVADITAGLRASLEIASQSPIAKYLRDLNLPTETALDDTALADHAKRWSQTEYHAVGTCTMGIDERAVVDPQLRVRGITGLRVVDASVMPAVVSGNTNGATVMIAEKAADLIKTPATTGRWI